MKSNRRRGSVLELLESRRLLALVAAYGFNEASGSSLIDSSGKGNTGAISGAAWTSGKYGLALSFNGSSDMVTIPDSSSLDLTSAMTLEAWVKPSSLSSGWTTAILKERTNGLAYSLYASDGANKPPAGYVNRSAGDANATGTTTLPLNTWSYLAATYNGSALKVYVNGSQVASKSISGAIVASAGALRIGGNNVWGEYFSGLIDEVRIYNNARSASQVVTDMNTPIAPANGDTTSPAASITAPLPGATVSGTISVSASASDNVVVAGVQFLLDGQPLGAEDTGAPYTISWNTSSASNGNHTLSARARDTSGNLGTSSAINISVSNVISPAQVGQWSSVVDFPLVDMHMALMKTGKILMWDGGPDCLGAITATVFDPSTGVFTPVPSESVQEYRDLFCSAPTVLADGRVLVVGGHDCTNPSYVGLAMSNIFDPVTQTWTDGPEMAYRRWYPSATTLPDGRALVTAGSDINVTSYIPIPEIFDPVTNTFKKVNASRTIPNYPFMFVLPDGRVLAAGSDEAKMATSVLDLKTNTWSTVDSTILDAGSAVMYLPGKIMKTGSSYLSPPADNGGSVPSAATTYTLDMTSGSGTWVQTQSMAYSRTHLNLTILPDGTVLSTGGSTDIGGVNPSKAVYAAELWNPATKTWSTMASMATPRLYHSTATLLPDGRVLVAGGGHNYYNNIAYPNAEYYSPGYLFKGPRPTITASPDTIQYNSSFFVGTPDGANIASVSLIRNGAVTHSFNMDQRYVPLSFTQTAGGLNVQAPANANLAPPGYYMLFIVDSNGVPSVAPFTRLPAAYEDSQAPLAPTNLQASAGAGAISLTWNPASDNIGVTRYNVYRSILSGFTPGASNLIAQVTATSYPDTGLASGTYYYVVTAEDAAGNVSLASNVASATVVADTSFPTISLTSPAPGAIVTGSISLGASASDDIGVVGVRFLVDGVGVGSEDTTAPYSISWNSTTAINGSHVITAVARDAAGNQTTSAPVSITVSNPSTSGLVAAYGFEEGAGATLGDASGTGNAGTINGATWTTAGKYGSALSFNGTSNWVTVADSNPLDLTTGMTIEAWLKPTALSGWTTAVLKERGSGATGGLAYSLYASDNTNRPPAGYINRNSTDYSAAAASALPLNAWTHVATTYDGTTIRIYVNGALAGSKAVGGAMTTSNSPLRIGGNSIWGEYFSGLIDEVRIYKVALTAAQIQSDMNTAVSPQATLTAALFSSVPISDPPATSDPLITALSAPARVARRIELTSPDAVLS